MIKKYLIYQPVKVESLACNLFCVLDKSWFKVFYQSNSFHQEVLLFNCVPIHKKFVIFLDIIEFEQVS